jgi:hypothetical protein
VAETPGPEAGPVGDVTACDRFTAISAPATPEYAPPKATSTAVSVVASIFPAQYNRIAPRTIIPCVIGVTTTSNECGILWGIVGVVMRGRIAQGRRSGHDVIDRRGDNGRTSGPNHRDGRVGVEQ